MNAEGRYLIELLSAELRGEKAAALPDGCDSERLFALAEYHSVSGMALYALERNGTVLEKELLERWRQSRDKALVKDITQQAELERIGESLAAAGIRQLPLKGSILKHLYPQSDMRTMSDIDILIDEENADEVREIMLGLGYTCEDFDKGAHDVYYMPPVMNIEIHRTLFEEHGKEYARVFSDPWAMSGADEGGMVYSFSGEAFFAYLLAHAAGHFEDCGIGVRSIMDLWVYANSENAASPERAFALLEPSGKSNIARGLYALSQVWFGGEPLTADAERLEDYIMSSGVHGTIANSAQNCINRNGKGRYVLKKFFPPFSFMRSQYPVLKKFPPLLPIVWIIRIVGKLCGERAENAERLRVLLKK